MSEIVMFRDLSDWFVAVIIGAACLLGASRIAEAHAILVEATPAVNSTVAGPDVDVRLRFNVRIDRARSRFTLVLPDGTARSLKLMEEKSHEILSGRATGLGPGDYRLRWQVLAADGHITRGDIPFRVAGP